MKFVSSIVQPPSTFPVAWTNLDHLLESLQGLSADHVVRWPGGHRHHLPGERVEPLGGLGRRLALDLDLEQARDHELARALPRVQLGLDPCGQALEYGLDLPPRQL